MASSISEPVKLTGLLITLESPIDPCHAEEIAEMANDVVIRDRIGAHSFPHPYTVEHAIDFIERNRVMDSAPFAMDFVILFKGKPAGIVGLSDINHMDRKAHLGYWVGSRFRGRGIATEAAALVCSYAFEVLGMRRLETKVLEDNLASMRVLIKNGFEVEGIEREAFLVNGKFTSFILFSKIEHQPYPSR